jgi:hypothetical protein
MRTGTPLLTALAGALQTQETNTAGGVAELTECRRSEGVLNVRIRFRNTGEAKASFYPIDGRNDPQGRQRNRRVEIAIRKGP